MILEIYLLIVGLSIALLISGYFLEDTALQLVGLAFLFIAGTIMAGFEPLNAIGGTLQYKTGVNETIQYFYTNNSVDYTNSEITYIYESFDNATSKFVGIFMSIVSILASAVIFTRLKQESENEY